MSSLNLLQGYLHNHKRKTKVDSFFSSWKNILSRVLQVLSWVHIWSIFLSVICSWYWAQSILWNMQMLILLLKYAIRYRYLEEVVENLMIWFLNNQLKLNEVSPASKYQRAGHFKNNNYYSWLWAKFHKAYRRHLLKWIEEVKCICKTDIIHDIF